MTQAERDIKRKLAILEHAKSSGNAAPHKPFPDRLGIHHDQADQQNDYPESANAVLEGCDDHCKTQAEYDKAYLAYRHGK